MVVLIPAPWDREIDGLRRAMADPALGRVPAHITLVPPVNVAAGRLGDALAVLRAAAATSAPFSVTVGPTATFAPAAPVLYLAAEAPPLRPLRHAVFGDPLARTVTHDFVPHVTLAEEASAERLAAGVIALAGYRAEIPVRSLHLMQEGRRPDGVRVWEPLADSALGRPALVGRGGLPLELTTSSLVGPDTVELLGVNRPGPPGMVITARREGVVVGAVQAIGGRLGRMTVAPDVRRQGIGAHLLARLEALALEDGWPEIVAAAGPDDPLTRFLRARGWAPMARPAMLSRRF